MTELSIRPEEIRDALQRFVSEYQPDAAYLRLYHEALAASAARLAQDCIRKVEVLEYAELGMEAVWRIEVEDFPAFIVIDDKGNDFFKELNLG